MKTLLLMRHAKASAANSSVADLERPLVDEGRTVARRVGEYLKNGGVLVDGALSSPATRARETIDLVLQAAGMLLEVQHDKRLYESGPSHLLEVLSGVPDERSTVLLVGHNPAIEELVQALTGRSEPFAPGTLAKIMLEANAWSSIVEGRGVLESVARPKDLH